VELKELLLKDYELKVRYLSDQFARMWTRFNFFLTITSGLIGGRFVIGNGSLNWQLALFGAVLAFIWYVFGAQDRYLVRAYRKSAQEAGRSLAGLVGEDFARTYAPVGQVEDVGAEGITSWRFEPVSITKLASLFPLFITIVWLLVLASELVR
jgi:hypothetical protein